MKLKTSLLAWMGFYMKASYYLRKTSDIDTVKDLHKICFPEDEWYSHKGNTYWLLKNKNKRPIGFCVATDIGDGIIFLSRAGIIPEYQGRGLQRRMINTRIRYAQNNGYNSVITYVSIENVASAKNLLKCGFELYRPDWDYAGHWFNYFRLELG